MLTEKKMTTVELAVVTSWPLRRLESGDLEIEHTLRIHLPHVPANASIASYLLNATNWHVLWWHEERQTYCTVDVARPISTLTSQSMQSLPKPFLLFQGAIEDNAGHLRSDDVFLLPSSHTGDTPPRQPFMERLRNTATQHVTPTRAGSGRRHSSRTPRSSPTLFFSEAPFSDAPSESFSASGAFDYLDEAAAALDGEAAAAAAAAEQLNAHETEGIYLSVNVNTTTWKVVLHRADKEVVFMQFFERFCAHFELTGDPLPISASLIKIHLVYLDETGVGDGLVVEMLSYIWMHLFANTHHFVRADNAEVKGYCVPADHPDTCLLMGHFGLLAAVSLSYAVRPHDLHPMFLRRADTQDDYRCDAMLYDESTCGFIPSSYEDLKADRADLLHYWNEDHDFARRVMPLERVTSESIFQRVVRPEMYKCIIFPTALAKRNLDTFRFYLFDYAKREMNGISPELVERCATVTYDLTSKADQKTLFHLGAEDKRDASAKATMKIFRSILAEYPESRIRKLIMYVTNRHYPTPILVRFRDSTYISTCWNILQLKARDKETMAEELDVILAVDLPNMPYHEQE